MRQKPGTKQSHGEKIVKDIRRASRKQYSAEEKISSRCQRLERMPSIRRFRISAANIGPNRRHQTRTVSWLISMPRSWSRSSTFRSESGNRM